jgi:hypothetical protein
LQGVRTKQFRQVRMAVDKRLLYSRPAFGTPILAVQQIVVVIGRLPMYSIRLDHTYHLAEFVDLQVRHVWYKDAAGRPGGLSRLITSCKGYFGGLYRQPCAHNSFTLALWQPSLQHSRCNIEILPTDAFHTQFIWFMQIIFHASDSIANLYCRCSCSFVTVCSSRQDNAVLWCDLQQTSPTGAA